MLSSLRVTRIEKGSETDPNTFWQTIILEVSLGRVNFLIQFIISANGGVNSDYSEDVEQSNFLLMEKISPLRNNS